jgi:hypothetical protein
VWAHLLTLLLEAAVRFDLSSSWRVAGVAARSAEAAELCMGSPAEHRGSGLCEAFVFQVFVRLHSGLLSLSLCELREEEKHEKSKM